MIYRKQRREVVKEVVGNWAFKRPSRKIVKKVASILIYKKQNRKIVNMVDGIFSYSKPGRKILKKVVSILTYRKPRWELCSQEGGGYSDLQEAASKDSKEGGR